MLAMNDNISLVLLILAHPYIVVYSHAANPWLISNIDTVQGLSAPEFSSQLFFKILNGPYFYFLGTREASV